MAKVKTLENFLIEELKEAFQNHLKETEGHVTRLEKISQMIGKTLTGKKCKAMEGLVEEGKGIIEEDMTDDVRDVALIAAGQKVEHYEIASYGCARTYASLIDLPKVEDLLQETLDEEGNANKLLTEISESLNSVALEG